MAILNLTNQIIAHNEIAPKLQHMKSLLVARKIMWDKLSIKQRKKWVVSEKDPIMNIAWSIYKYLDSNFFEDTEEK